MLRADQLDVDRAMLLVIDMQEKILPLVVGQDRVVDGARKILAGVIVFELPVLATEQYPKGLGPTHADLGEPLRVAGALVLEKPTFSAWHEETIRTAMLTLDRTQVIIAGIETHVCVQQTALDLRSRDYDVFVCADAVGARSRVDHETALDRMRLGGVFVTSVESVLFELCGRCDTAGFKKMLEVIKQYPPNEAKGA